MNIKSNNGLTARQKQVLRRRVIRRIAQNIGVVLLVVAFFMILCMAGTSDAEAEGIISTTMNIKDYAFKIMTTLILGGALYYIPDYIWK